MGKAKHTSEEIQRNWKIILGVGQNPTMEELKKARAQKTREYSPDMFPGQSVEFLKRLDEKLGRINAAFDWAVEMIEQGTTNDDNRYNSFDWVENKIAEIKYCVMVCDDTDMPLLLRMEVLRRGFLTFRDLLINLYTEGKTYEADKIINKVFNRKKIVTNKYNEMSKSPAFEEIKILIRAKGRNIIDYLYELYDDDKFYEIENIIKDAVAEQKRKEAAEQKRRMEEAARKDLVTQLIENMKNNDFSKYQLLVKLVRSKNLNSEVTYLMMLSKSDKLYELDSILIEYKKKLEEERLEEQRRSKPIETQGRERRRVSQGTIDYYRGLIESKGRLGRLEFEGRRKFGFVFVDYYIEYLYLNEMSVLMDWALGDMKNIENDGSTLYNFYRKNEINKDHRFSYEEKPLNNISWFDIYDDSDEIKKIKKKIKY